MEIRLIVAVNRATPIDSLLLLAGDIDSSVRQTVIKNQSATAEVKAIASLLK